MTNITENPSFETSVTAIELGKEISLLVTVTAFKGIITAFGGSVELTTKYDQSKRKRVSVLALSLGKETVRSEVEKVLGIDTGDSYMAYIEISDAENNRLQSEIQSRVKEYRKILDERLEADRVQKIMDMAKRTGERQLLSKIVVDGRGWNKLRVNGGPIQCQLTWALPDGLIHTEIVEINC